MLNTLTAAFIAVAALFHPHLTHPNQEHFTVDSTCYAEGGLTASGTQAHIGEVAVMPGFLPLGSRIKLDRPAFGRRVFRVEDHIRSGSELDVFYPSEVRCEAYGRQRRGFVLLTR